MELLILLAVALSSGVSMSAGLVLLCYKLCYKRKPSWQADRKSEFPYIPIRPITDRTHRSHTSVHTIQPPSHEEEQLLPPNPLPKKLSTIPEVEPPKPPAAESDPPPPTPPRPHPFVTRKTQQDLEIARRFAEGKVAELEMWIIFRNNILEMTIRKIDKIHDSINKKEAYVRVKNPRERKISIPTLRYSNNFQALLGSHNFRFNMTIEQLQTMVFRFYLWSVDKNSRQREFGEFALDFKEVTKARDLNIGYTDKFDFLVYDTKPLETDPSIRLRLKYHCKSSKIIVSILEIKDLHQSSSAFIQGGIYVKVLLMNNQTRRQQEYKTKHVKGRNPQFHTTFNHNVSLRELEETTMYVHIKARTVHTDTLSVLEFSSNATGRLGEHWTQMIQGISAGYGVEMTHRISQEKRRPPNLARRFTTTTFF